jgi:CubicO group peptidase (beta-lactamase class C family)
MKGKMISNLDRMEREGMERGMFDYKVEMDRILRQEVALGKGQEGGVKGASALILHRGEELYFNAFGEADSERGTPMSRDTIIRLYSMTKPVTAVAVMLLAERGRLDLWDPVSMYLPCFKGQKVWDETLGEVPAKRDNTIYDLLNMTSGITYPDENTEPGRRMKAMVDDFVARREQGERVDTKEYVRGIASIPLCFQPGDRWMYGFSADVLGGIVEAVSGMSYGAFLERELFEPLEMPDTRFYVPEGKRGRLAQHYDMTEKGVLIPHKGSHLGEYCGEDVAFESGGAGLVSTLDDYAHFAMMMVKKGTYKGRRIMGRKTVEFMTQNRLTASQARSVDWDSMRGYGYGCLMRVLMDQGAAGSNASLGEYGWDGWTGNYVTMDPCEELVLLYFIQRCGASVSAPVRRLRMAAYGALE